MQGVHCPGVVDIVRRDKGGIQRARSGSTEELPDKVIFLSFPVKDPVDPEILSACVRGEVLQVWIVGVLGRFEWVGANMAETAGHSHSVWAYQVLALVVVVIRVLSTRVPVLGRSLIEIGVGEEPQPDDSGFIAIERNDWEVLTVDFRAGGADFCARIFLLVLERIGFALRATFVQPQPASLRIGPTRLFKTGIIDEAKVLPASIATESRVDLQQFRVGGEDFQKVQGPGAPVDQRIPEPVIACGPYQPGVTSLYKRRLIVFGRTRSNVDAAIHVMEVVLVGSVKAGSVTCGKECLIFDASGVRLPGPVNGVASHWNGNHYEQHDKNFCPTPL